MSVGVFSGIGAVALPSYAALFRRELLRSEQHIAVQQAFLLLQDKEVSLETRQHIGKIVEGVLIAGADGSERLRNQKKNPAGQEVEDDND